jgi:hypothetical protein
MPEPSRSFKQRTITGLVLRAGRDAVRVAVYRDDAVAGRLQKRGDL